MKPIFFPFTSLTHFDAVCILNRFESFNYFSTSSCDELLYEPEWFQNFWKEKHVINPVTLSEEELTPLLGSVKSWQSWANANYGKQAKAGYLQSIFKETPYFKSDNDIFAISSAIRSQIEKGNYGIANNLKTDNSNQIAKLNLETRGLDNINNALLFLKLATIADRENEEVDQKLSAISKFETDIFSELKGDEENDIVDNSNLDSNTLSATNTDRGEFMTEQRIRAWFTLFCTKQHLITESFNSIFITTSRAVIDFIISINEKSKLMLDIDSFKVQKEISSSANANYELFQIKVENLPLVLNVLDK